MSKDVAFTPAWELAELIWAKKLSPVEIVNYLLQRIGHLNPKLNAYLTVTEAEAKPVAKAAQEAVMKGEELPPLHGIPISIKDLNFTKGIRTTSGSLVYKDFVPHEDEVAVERLRRAGAIILGKTNTPEFGQSATTENRLGDHCRNPWNVERTTGGSSGGAAAAVAAGLGPLALGNDGGGSIRIPAGFCGVYGLKPTHGRVPVRPSACMPLFSVNGSITRTVRDAALMLDVMSGYDRRDPASLREKPPRFLDAINGGLEGLVVAWSPDLGYAKVEPEVRSVAQSAAYVFQSLGCHVEEATPACGEPFSIFSAIALADTYAAQGHLLQKHAEELMDYVKSSLEFGERVKGYEYSRALAALACLRRNMAEFFERYDLLLTPTNAVPAFPVGQRPREIDGQEVNRLWGPFPFTTPFNLTGQPAASVPCGFSSDGLPIGLQIVGRWGDEATVLRASAAFERAQPWAHRTPPLS